MSLQRARKKRLTGLVFIFPCDGIDSQGQDRVQDIHDQLIEEETDQDWLFPDCHVVVKTERPE